MSEEKKIVDWNDLEEIADLSTKVVELPATSKALGHEVFAKIRAIDPMDLVGALNFPMDEINQMVADKTGEFDLGKSIVEHTEAFDLGDLLATVEKVVMAGLVEPDPSGGNVKKLKGDFMHLFTEIVALTMPPKEVDEAATFPANGE